MEKETILVILKEYFKELALDWHDDHICLIDDYIDLERLADIIATDDRLKHSSKKEMPAD